MRARIALIGAVATLLLLPVTAQAQGWEFGARVIWVVPDSDSTPIGETGTTVKADDAFAIELDLEYMLNDRWGLELIAATPKHDLRTVGGALGGLSAGKVWLLPPTLTLLYHLPAMGSARFYGGLGLNYTKFYSYELSGDLEAAGVSRIEFSDSWGLAADVGVDIEVDEQWYLNVDVKYVQMSTDATLQLQAGGVLDQITVDVNPWIFGAGLGYRF